MGNIIDDHIKDLFPNIDGENIDSDRKRILTWEEYCSKIDKLYENIGPPISPNCKVNGYDLYLSLHQHHILFPVIQNIRLPIIGSSPYKLIPPSENNDDLVHSIIQTEYEGNTWNVVSLMGNKVAKGYTSRLQELFQLGLAQVKGIHTVEGNASWIEPERKRIWEFSHKQSFYIIDITH